MTMDEQPEPTPPNGEAVQQEQPEFSATDARGITTPIRALTNQQLEEVFAAASGEREKAAQSFNAILNTLLTTDRIVAVIVFERLRRQKAEQRIVVPGRH
jgi:hypothetical protein